MKWFSHKPFVGLWRGEDIRYLTINETWDMILYLLEKESKRMGFEFMPIEDYSKGEEVEKKIDAIDHERRIENLEKQMERVKTEKFLSVVFEDTVVLEGEVNCGDLLLVEEEDGKSHAYNLDLSDIIRVKNGDKLRVTVERRG